jgi:hypothetical protein
MTLSVGLGEGMGEVTVPLVPLVSPLGDQEGHPKTPYSSRGKCLFVPLVPPKT